MAGPIPCTCGCGREVSYSTKRNHLNGHGKTSLRARVAAEVAFLRGNTWQQQEPTLLPRKGSKKRAPSNPDRDDNRKRRKAAQLEENQSPEIPGSQVDTDLIEDLLPPVTDRQSRFIERSRRVMEMRWTTGRRDGGDSGDGDDEEGDKDDEEGDKDSEEGDKEEDKDEDEDEPTFYPDIPGISNWDLLGEDFEREAANLGLYSPYELPTQLTMF
jgi:hypothetical protein